MAVTSIWPVKSRLDHVINYARNPEKTRERSLVSQASLHAIDNVIEYAADTRTRIRFVPELPRRQCSSANDGNETILGKN